MKKILQWILAFIYPRRCPVCGEIVLPKKSLVCDSCYDKLKLIKEPKCKQCGKPLQHVEQEYCYDCSRKNYHFEQGMAVWIYDKVMQKSIAAFKYKHRMEYADFYIHEVMDHYGIWLKQLQLDAIIPVPIHKRKRKIRGYNQAAVLAKGIGDELSIPVIEDVLLRVRNTLPQKELNDRERYRNLIEAFIVQDANYMLQHINKVLIVDDIYTTGSTIEACTNILKNAGVQKVYFICLCIGKGY